MAYYDKEGNEVEGVMAAEEVDAKIEEVSKELQTKYDDEKTAADERTAELEEEVAAAKAAVDKAGDSGDKDENFAELRRKLKDTEKLLKDSQKSNEERWSSLEGGQVETIIASVAGDDKELAKKIRHNYEKTLSAVKATNSEEMKNKVQSAYKLSVDTPAAMDPLAMIGAGGSRGAVLPKMAGDNKPPSAVELEVGKHMGVSSDDWKKYGNDPRLKA